jgi:diacylglycerol kinase (ATP)
MLLAALVAQSRVEGNIHNRMEVLMGAALGVIVMTIIFQIAK